MVNGEEGRKCNTKRGMMVRKKLFFFILHILFGLWYAKTYKIKFFVALGEKDKRVGYEYEYDKMVLLYVFFRHNAGDGPYCSERAERFV